MSYPKPFDSVSASGLLISIPIASQHSANAGWSFGRPVDRMLMKPLKVSPVRSLIGLLSAPRGHQVWISGTFSSIITRGLTSNAHLIETQARPLILLSTGLPPFAREKCLQSGENQASATGLSPHASLGSTSQTSSQ